MEKTSPPQLFCEKRREAVELRAMHIGKEDADFLSHIAAETIRDRISVVNREFEIATDFLSTHNVMIEQLKTLKNINEIKQIISPARQKQYGLTDNATIIGSSVPEIVPLHAQSTNLITCVFSLHESNDLPGSLIQIRRALVNDGLFMAALPGENTLYELRDSLLTAESEVNGTASLRVEPFGEIRQLGGLLQRAGFAIPVVDSEILTIRYPDFDALIRELRAIGATSRLAQTNTFAGRRIFERAKSIYKEKYAAKDGKIPATVEIIFLSGWAPDESQQKPLKPGSAKAQLKDFL